MNKLNLFLAATILSAATSSFAENGYGLAGCGLGAVVLGKKGPQILVATTNGTFGSQTFGITSGTLNCSEDGIALAAKEKEYFANANYESLIQEMAQGQGENLQAMATLYGCPSEAFSSAMHSNYGKIANQGVNDAGALLASVENVLVDDSGLKNSCTELN